ncbi:acyltransferase family protein [Arthrobacter monumenti]
MKGFRKDIQGLRALAVSLVVLYHLWPNRLTGGFVGVDIFFVISGFLITSHLLAKPPQGFADLGRFWSRRIRRLLPASLLVLVATAVATRLVAPVTQWHQIAQEIIASALYVENWLLASSSTDYLAGGGDASPVQHFWSLSVEEQFYIAWPILLLGAFWFAARRNLAPKRVAQVVIGAVICASLITSVAATAASPASAYFITPTRMWELAMGGLIATLPALKSGRIGDVAAPILAWTGIGAMVAAGVFYTSSTPFPSYTALLPVLGAALVIWAGATGPYSPTAVLEHGPIQWLGNVSYSVYLWHWPLIALLPFASGDQLGRLDKFFILVATLLLAGLSKAWVEDRFRFGKTRSPLVASYRFAAAGMTAVVAVGAVQIMEVEYREGKAAEQLQAAIEGDNPCFGAAALAEGNEHCPPPKTDAELVPGPALAAEDMPKGSVEECQPYPPYEDRATCTFGSGPKQVALVGNSHAGHWLPALEVLAEENGWTITTYLMSRCNATDVKLEFDTEEQTENCSDWGKWVMEETKGDKYDLVVTSERQSVPVQGYSYNESNDPARKGYKSYLSKWTDAGTNLLVIKDPTYPKPSSVPECLAENPDDHFECAGPKEDWAVMTPLNEAAQQLDDPNISTLNMDKYFCRDGTCYSAIGGVVTYFDGSHISATYAATLAPYMEKLVEKALKK